MKTEKDLRLKYQRDMGYKPAIEIDAIVDTDTILAARLAARLNRQDQSKVVIIHHLK